MGSAYRTMEESTTVSRGQVVLQMPVELTEDDFDEIRQWLGYIGNKLDRMQAAMQARAAQIKAQQEAAAANPPLQAVQEAAPPQKPAVAWKKPDPPK